MESNLFYLKNKDFRMKVKFYLDPKIKGKKKKID